VTGDTYNDNRHSNNVGPMSGGVNYFCSPGHPGEAAESPLPPNRKVFVVHGRDSAARQAVFEFLRALDLKPLGWETMVAATGSAAPHVLQVVRQGFAEARAVVVLLTPDDFAYLHETLQQPADLPYERSAAGQPRQNALFEAGMAMALHPNRTILLQVGGVRPFTDVFGLDFIQVDGSAGKLNNIAQRLKLAGCDVDLTGDDWMDTGRFDGLAAAHRGT
jgi:predicted nucleotide-binding protein